MRAKLRRSILHLATFAILAAIIACGGGSGDAPSGSASGPPAVGGVAPEVVAAVRGLAIAGTDRSAIVTAALSLDGMLDRSASLPDGIVPLQESVSAALEGLPEAPDAAPVEPAPVPRFTEPPYSGAIRMRGRYRGPYDGGFLGRDGVVIQSGGEYFVVLGAAAASIFTTRMNGYATPTGRTVTLNLGRAGRDAEVYEFADRETYEDDQRAHRAAVGAARAEHRARQDAYPAAMAAFRDAERAHRDATRTWEEALEERSTAIDALPSAASAALQALE